MKKYLLYPFMVLLLLSLIQFQSCKKEVTGDPEVQTISVTALSPSKALLKGSIVNTGKLNVLDYGFIYSSSSNISETTGTKISLGNNVQAGDYSKVADGLILTNYYYNNQTTLYVRAYLTNSKGTAFGKLMSVNMPIPTVGSVSPQSGKVGDQITITGQFYASSIDQVHVTFNNVQAKVIEVSDSKIVVEVPSGILSSNNSQIPIQISIGGQTITASSTFTILANVKDFSPKSGPIGTLITFSGDNLPSGYYYSNGIRIFFGQVEGSFYNYYSNSLQAVVPSTVTTGNFQISIIINGQTTVLPGNFTVTPPTITSISPTSDLAGGTLVVNGTNLPTAFAYGSTNPSATLGNTTLPSPYSVSNSQLSFNIPGNMSPGDYTFTLNVGPYSIVAPQKFTVIAPSISSFSPSTGGAGTDVNIQGTFRQGQSYWVYFGTTGIYGTATSSTNLKVQVPSGVQAGNVNISVSINNQTIAANTAFTVIGPSITSFSPASGVAGTVVTITGAGFNPNTYYTSVKFGTINAPVLSVTATSVSVMVPSGISPGAMKLSVVTNGQTVVSTDNFTVTN